MNGRRDVTARRADPAGTGPPQVAARALRRMSEGFERKDLPGLLADFSDDESVTYAGSETGEVATGKPALQTLLTTLLDRDVHYSFTFVDIRANAIGEAIWVLAEGAGRETAMDGSVEDFPYRVCGLLTPEHHHYRWLLLNGGEPAEV
jgi:hypothetical protein